MTVINYDRNKLEKFKHKWKSVIKEENIQYIAKQLSKHI
ncbi:hypothetical protein SHYC_05435 [Staphylococcus hyicus]|nr:hypothetical protein SHYC_05435 [Staphylococcus hyicus]SQE47341.1 Uncharacterised protein [Staphylococcus hyicus]